MIQHRTDRRFIEARACVDNLQQQLRLAETDDRQRVARARSLFELPCVPAVALRAQRGIERRVLVHDEARQHPATRASMSMNARRRQPRMRSHREPLRAKALEPWQHRRPGLDLHSQRHRVDAHAHHVPQAVGGGTSKSDGGVEGNVGLSAVAGENPGPRGQQQGVQREFVVAREASQRVAPQSRNPKLGGRVTGENSSAAEPARFSSNRVGAAAPSSVVRQNASAAAASCRSSQSTYSRNGCAGGDLRSSPLERAS